MRKAGLLIAVLGTVLYWAPGAQAYECGTTLDTFTRANGTNLGPNWTEQAPDPAILAGTFNVAAAQTGLATFNGLSSNEACVDVATPPAGVSYAAIVLRYGALTANVFVKVQDNDANGSFDRVFFYKGNNGTPWNPAQNPHIVPAFSSARLHLLVVGTAVTADIDTNFDDQPEQTIVEQGLPTDGLGNGIGLAAYGNARLDNFAIPTSEVPDTAKFSCRGKPATLVGSNARDVLRGTNRADVIVGLGGRDTLRGRGGKDRICGGNGRDTLAGGKAKDKLYGDAGRDILRGGAKNDTCRGGPGRDVAKNC